METHPTALVRLQRVHGRDADLVFDVSILGFTLKEAAQRHGLTDEAARKRDQRALVCLCAVFRKAIDDGPQSETAAMLWLKTRTGWREATEQPVVPVDARIARMSDAELEAAISEVTRKIEMTAEAMECEH